MYKDNTTLLKRYDTVELYRNVRNIFDGYIQFRQSGIRVRQPEYFPTLLASGINPIYGKEKRYLTPREHGRLQSFPDKFKLHKMDNVSYKQFGNAVNVKCVAFCVDHFIPNNLK